MSGYTVKPVLVATIIMIIEQASMYSAPTKGKYIDVLCACLTQVELYMIFLGKCTLSACHLHLHSGLCLCFSTIC